MRKCTECIAVVNFRLRVNRIGNPLSLVSYVYCIV